VSPPGYFPLSLSPPQWARPVRPSCRHRSGSLSPFFLLLGVRRRLFTGLAAIRLLASGEALASVTPTFKSSANPRAGTEALHVRVNLPYAPHTSLGRRRKRDLDRWIWSWTLGPCASAPPRIVPSGRRAFGLGVGDRDPRAPARIWIGRANAAKASSATSGLLAWQRPLRESRPERTAYLHVPLRRAFCEAENVAPQSSVVWSSVEPFAEKGVPACAP